MRRTQLQFVVAGSNHADLLEQALRVYRHYVGEEVDSLPSQSSMEVHQQEVLSTGSVTVWEGTVTIPITV